MRFKRAVVSYKHAPGPPQAQPCPCLRTLVSSQSNLCVRKHSTTITGNRYPVNIVTASNECETELGRVMLVMPVIVHLHRLDYGCFPFSLAIVAYSTMVLFTKRPPIQDSLHPKVHDSFPLATFLPLS